eukprot:gb/GECG01007928.1/.p1 GENE.gb/GECG01007928.1/~~gb/GECG01007928.1/.p1  ORF type:complete len:875 (+),score=92.83 gb/GECG01007928.1/:1-2625(+)
MEWKWSRGCLYLENVDQYEDPMLVNFARNNELRETTNNYTLEEVTRDWIDAVPSQFRDNRVLRDGSNHWHITVINSIEMKETCAVHDIETILAKDGASAISDLIIAGMGRVFSKESTSPAESYFLVVVSEQLNHLRHEFGLDDRLFHITVGFSFSDVHEKAKSLNTIFRLPQLAYQKKTILRSLSSSESMTNLTYLQWLLNTGDARILKVFSEEVISCIAHIPKRHPLYQQALHVLMEERYLGGYYLHFKQMSQGYNEKQIVESMQELLTSAKTPLTYCRKAMPQKVQKVLNFPMLQGEPLRKWYRWGDDGYFHTHPLPRNFSWIDSNVAGSGIPHRKEFLETFEKMGVSQIITLMEEPLAAHVSLDGQFKEMVNFFNVTDRRPPPVKQMHSILQLLLESSGNTVVHCMGGYGRTATVLLAYVMYVHQTGFQDAKRWLGRRPYKLDESQESFLKEEWYRACNEIRASEKGGLSTVQRNSKVKLPSLIMLMGLPASGKSTFAQSLEEQLKEVVRVNQDEIRNKQTCHEMVGRHTKEGKTVILDRCNPTRKDRQWWMKLQMGSRGTWSIYFDTTAEECKWRVSHRKDHPTLKASAGANVIDTLARQMEPPSKNEGYDKMWSVSSIQEANSLLEAWGCTTDHLEEPNYDNIIKFPRTRHLYNLGGASRDDLLFDRSEQDNFIAHELWIEEKIDGANLGISIQNYEIKVQNRSHYITASTHPQFKLINEWVHEHREDLWELLGDGSTILYGEWLYAQHSIPYTELPDYFVAFDVYDKREKRFYSRKRFEEALKPTSIATVPALAYGKFSSSSEILKYVHQPSQFYEGPVEGIYLRICTERWLEQRAKVVREDFLSGNTHWSHYSITPNRRSVSSYIAK